MAVLSKTVIEQISQKMTEKSKNYANALLKDYEQIVLSIYETQIPDEVKKCFKNHSEFIETTSSIYLDGHGFNRESVFVGKAVPATSSYHQKINLTAAIAEKIIKVKRKWEKARDDYKQLFLETESALFALKTHKNVRENLPAAIPFLPPPMSNALVVNFDSLKKRLDKQPEAKKELATA